MSLEPNDRTTPLRDLDRNQQIGQLGVSSAITPIVPPPKRKKVSSSTIGFHENVVSKIKIVAHRNKLTQSIKHTYQRANSESEDPNDENIEKNVRKRTTTAPPLIKYFQVLEGLVEKDEIEARRKYLFQTYGHVQSNADKISSSDARLFFVCDTEPRRKGKCFYSENQNQYFATPRRSKGTTPEDYLTVVIERNGSTMDCDRIDFFISGMAIRFS